MLGLADVNALTKVYDLLVAALCVVKVDAVLAKLSEPAKLAAKLAPEPVAVKPKL